MSPVIKTLQENKGPIKHSAGCCMNIIALHVRTAPTLQFQSCFRDAVKVSKVPDVTEAQPSWFVFVGSVIKSEQ